MALNGASGCDIIQPKACENTHQEKILSSGIQLRTSARVLKKQKLDLEASLAVKEAKKDEKVEVEVSSSQPQPQPQSVPTKQRSKAVVWSPEDKNAFFDALNEAGKDLEWIERYMRGKSKKRLGDMNGPSVTYKTRLQIKYFYQRSLTKIAKYIQLPENVKKSTQELYILINYGELRKRIGLINERNAQKLKELIYCGSTQVRAKGKTWRVKTPVCRALKRLNHLEESVDEVKLPTRVEFLLSPRENKDGLLVEGLGYNSRLKTSLSVDMPIVNLITYLQNRWSSYKDNHTDQNVAQNCNLQLKTPDPGGGNSGVTCSGANVVSISNNVVKPNPISNATACSQSSSSPKVLNSSLSTGSSVNSAVNSTTPSKAVCNALPDLSDCINDLSSVQNGASPPRSQSTKESMVCKELSSPNSKTRSSQSNLQFADTQSKSPNVRSDTKSDSNPSKTPVTYVKSESVRPPRIPDNKGVLWLGAKPNASLTKTNYKCGQLVTSSCISLIAHQAKIGSPLASLETLIQVPPPAVKASKSWAKWHKEGEPVDEFVNADVCDPTALPSSSIPTTTSVTSTSSVLPSFSSQLGSTAVQSPAGVTSTTGGSFSPNPFPTFGSCHVPWPVPPDPPPESAAPQIADLKFPPKPREESKEEFEARVRKGWCVGTAARLRVADLYLIFGNNGRLEAEYWWEGETTSELPSLVRLLSLAKLWQNRIPLSPRECWACGYKAPLHNNTNTQSSNQIILDTEAELKSETPDTVNSTAATVVVVSPSPTTAGRFRQPLLPAPSSTKRLKSTDETYKSLQLRSKYTNRRGRYRPKNVVVQRMLPLLPKNTTPPPCTVVTLQVVANKDPTGPATGEFINTKSLGVREPLTALKQIAPKPPAADIPIAAEVALGEKLDSSEEVKPDPFNFISCSLSKDSPPSVSSELHPTPSSFSGFLGGGSGSGDGEVVTTPPPSPSRILKEGESQWLNAEVSDFSLSSFLGHLESPLKTNGILPLEDTRMSADVDSQLQSLMTESSLDYTAKFADLAAKIEGPGSSSSAPTAPS